MNRFLSSLIFHVLCFGAGLAVVWFVDHIILQRMVGGPFNFFGGLGWIIRVVLYTIWGIALVVSLMQELPAHRLRFPLGIMLSLGVTLMMIIVIDSVKPGSTNGGDGQKPPVPAITIIGWTQLDDDGGGWRWFQPVNPELPTGWFPVKGKTIRYDAWTNMVWEVESLNGSTRRFFNNTATREKFASVSGGGFSQTPMTNDEFQKLIDEATKVRFIPDGGKPLNMRIGVLK